MEKNVQYMYDEHRFGNFEFDSNRDQYSELLFKEFIPLINNNDKVYDVGCGAGFVVRKLADVFKLQKENIFCVDLSTKNIEKLKELGFRGQVDDNLSLDIESNSSDRTISNGVIHHTKSPDMCMDELVRITKKGGLIYLSIYSNKVPYYKVIHCLGTPFRYIYWSINKKFIYNLIFPLVNIFFIQPLSLIVFRVLMNKESAKTLFMDQVISPNVFSFHRNEIIEKITSRNCEVVGMAYDKFWLMDSYIIKVN
jgi:SAM-dependent methyltransferase